jgi:triacylglycerol esterase/lipase EstA (alpha/beta hydrolase family)
VILPGYFATASDYRELEKSLVDRGFPTVTVPLGKGDWLPTLGGRSMVPILRLLDRTIKQMLQQYGVSQINLIGHSAGGWISRIYLGEKPYTATCLRMSICGTPNRLHFNHFRQAAPLSRAVDAQKSRFCQNSPSEGFSLVGSLRWRCWEVCF